MVCEDRAPDIGVILHPGMARQEGSTGHIGMTAGNGIPPQVGALVRIGVIAGDGVVKEPGIIPRPEGQVVLALYKAAKSPGLDLAADVPQGPDAVEKGIFLMGDIGQFVFLIDCCFISFLQTGEGPSLGTAPPVYFCLRF